MQTLGRSPPLLADVQNVIGQLVGDGTDSGGGAAVVRVLRGDDGNNHHHHHHRSNDDEDDGDGGDDDSRRLLAGGGVAKSNLKSASKSSSSSSSSSSSPSSSSPSSKKAAAVPNAVAAAAATTTARLTLREHAPTAALDGPQESAFTVVVRPQAMFGTGKGNFWTPFGTRNVMVSVGERSSCACVCGVCVCVRGSVACSLDLLCGGGDCQRTRLLFWVCKRSRLPFVVLSVLNKCCCCCCCCL